MSDELRKAAQAALKALDFLGDSADCNVNPATWCQAKAEAACTALRTALAAAQPPASVKESLTTGAQPPAAMPGWRWVPVEPTKPMLLAGAVADCCAA